MRVVIIPLPPHLPSRWNIVYKSRVAAVGMLATHQQRSDYITKHGSWTQLKKWLAAFSGYKCWYCEAKNPRAPLDVDHFRPKLGITVDGIKLAGHSGYYWLAYEWSNFRLSCQRCNRPEKDEADTLHGKANEFPIEDEAHRCQVSAAPLAAESPRLLDPCVQADCELLAHGIDGEVKAAAPDGTWESQRADYTIKQLGFNEWNTPESKRSRWQTLATLIAIAGNNTNQLVIDELKRNLSFDQEYSSFLRSAIGTHRDKAWVEALL
ncbi:HNH endonuclease [Paraburkholderia panacisoli]|uniref:HNH endonuclease n=1 Tax=Paraburkholderia panacisoli TaxID=2603818 RepID=A0A5B0HIK8_9BURK|nr:HNH endonuclease signature motif containing protein [Paraburkholderia panacisoli]KAA1015115.1 HNH endonuclease [Paraburkholderia panacisoli]